LVLVFVVVIAVAIAVIVIIVALVTVVIFFLLIYVHGIALLGLIFFLGGACPPLAQPCWCFLGAQGRTVAIVEFILLVHAASISLAIYAQSFGGCFGRWANVSGVASSGSREPHAGRLASDMTVKCRPGIQTSPQPAY
jgi:hypothetical protein